MQTDPGTMMDWMNRLVWCCAFVLPAAFASCIPLAEQIPVTGPEEPSGLAVHAETDTPNLLEGAEVTLSAAASGGTEPYLFRWDLNGGPEELPLEDVTFETLRTGPLTTPGRYVFRVIVTDADGFHATDFVTVEVTSIVTLDVPPLAVVDEPVGLSATIHAEVQEVDMLWEVVRGTASLDGPASADPMLTATTGETIELRYSLHLLSEDGLSAEATRSVEIVSVHSLRPQVLIETNLGAMTLELDGERAPLHTANFLLYVDDGFYDGLLFHRNACSDQPVDGLCEEPFVLQGGGFKRVDGELEGVEAPRDPVPSEADNGLSNSVMHSVALALFGGDADSGTTQFFINLGDNSHLDEQNFTVFGLVVDGFEVLDAIVGTERTDNPIIPGEVSLPVEDVIMEHVTRVGP